MGTRDGTLAARDVQPAFEGTIASACALGISLADFLEMARLARTSDPRAARFLAAWEALDASEQQARGAADAVCRQIGLNPTELLSAAARAAISVSKCVVEMETALALPSVVAQTIRMALTPKGTADRKMIFQHTGFLPTPRGSQTFIGITQNAQANTTAQRVAMPKPEETIRRLAEQFNKSRGMPLTPATALPMAEGSPSLPGATPGCDEHAYFETDGDEDDDGR